MPSASNVVRSSATLSRSVPRSQASPRIPRTNALSASSGFKSEISPPTHPAARFAASTPSKNIPATILSATTPLHLAAAMSTMPATHGHSAACCNIPPVIAAGYEPKGTYETIGGFKTYITGPADATKAVVLIYDIFGYFPQTLQGADILATSDSRQKYRVIIPDWFLGSPADISWYPPNTEEKQKSLGAFFGKNAPTRVAGEVAPYVNALQEKYPSLKDLAIMGFCWGGKVVTLVTSSDSNPFKAGISCHPAMVDPTDGPKVKVPFCLLASGDEDATAVKDFAASLQVPKYFETFGDQIHGWMAARSDLENPRVKEEYVRGYKTVLDFLSKHV